MSITRDREEKVFLTRSTDYALVERLSQLEERLRYTVEHAERIEKELEELQKEVLTQIIPKLSNLENLEVAFKPYLETLNKAFTVGVTLKWLITFVIGAFAAIGSIITSLELFKRWTSSG